MMILGKFLKHFIRKKKKKMSTFTESHLNFFSNEIPKKEKKRKTLTWYKVDHREVFNKGFIRSSNLNYYIEKMKMTAIEIIQPGVAHAVELISENDFWGFIRLSTVYHFPIECCFVLLNIS
jgi:hypothetical protein